MTETSVFSCRTRGMRERYVPIIEIFIVVLVGRKLIVVNPDIGRLLDCYMGTAQSVPGRDIYNPHSNGSDLPIASVGAMTFWILSPRTITLLTLMTRIPILTRASNF